MAEDIREPVICQDFLKIQDRNLSLITRHIRGMAEESLGITIKKGDKIKVAFLGVKQKGSEDLITLPIKIPEKDFKNMIEDPEAQSVKDAANGATRPPPEKQSEKKNIPAIEGLSSEDIVQNLYKVLRDPNAKPETKKIAKARLIEHGEII